jgi:hypothetical protein
MEQYGVSFSIKQCRNFNISPSDCLMWLIKDCGFRRFRLMSYWDELEPTPGKYDFKELDRQLGVVIQNKGVVTLCLGARQPRWPENHWPGWAWQLSKAERTDALLNFLEIVVKRYRHHECIISYQLENEALLRSFGKFAEVDRKRLRQEFELVKRLDPKRPIIMSTSTSWGIPLRKPIPDIVGFSYYQVHFNKYKQAYSTAFHKPWLHKVRALLIKVLWQRPSFIHELQLEPWGPKNIWDMPMTEQMRSMSLRQIKKNIRAAQKTCLHPIDLWGGEWWYWCVKKQGNTAITKTVLQTIKLG